MTTVSTTDSTSTTTSTSTSSNNSMSDLGIDDFISLMVAQLKNQDPTDPQDSSEFVAQLAQFSSVSGIQEMNSSMSTLVDELRSSQALSATSLVGHDVLLSADSMQVGSGEQVSGAVETPEGASTINIVVSDASGQVVRQFSVAASDDLTSFTWDGLDDSGQQVEAGEYSFSANADVYGTSEAAGTLLTSEVTSVTIDSSTNTLVLNTRSLGSVSLSDVRQVI